MSRFFIFLFLGLLACTSAVYAKPLVADLSQYHIEIDSSFTGTRLLLFGARNDIGDVVIVVRGPDRNFTVRKKERVAGMWINRRGQKFDNVPTYYMLASSKPFDKIHSSDLFAPLRIGLDQVTGGGDTEFSSALIRYQQAHNLYAQTGEKVAFMGESLFKFVIPFPDNIPRGDYSADVYLFRDGELESMQSIPLHIEKTGFDAWVSDFAADHSVVYGLSAVWLALAMGWAASKVMQRI